jgi:hypothetical protein
MILLLGIVITLLQCFKKWGWLDYYAAHYGHIKWLPDAGCYLCLGFWLSWIVLPFVIFLPWWILAPFAVAGFVNILLTLHEK